MLRRPPLKRLVLVLVTVVPVLAWAVVRPVRVVAPEFAGTTCVSASVCVDDLSQADAARALHAEAIDFVRANVSPIEGAPKVIFCSTEDCAHSFGLGRRSAVTFGTFGTVVGPRAWTPFYVRHELIHYAQAEHLGALGLMAKPSWFVEGMAYGLSEDPRAPLAEPWEGYRAEFSRWYAGIGKARLWTEAAKL